MTSQPHTSDSVGFARLFWMLLGPMILTLLALSIVTRGDSWFTMPDLAFLVFLFFLPLARWYEFHAGNAQTSTGEAASEYHLRRYVLATLIVGLAAWVLANVLGVHVLGH